MAKRLRTQKDKPRRANELREIRITRRFTDSSAGSVLFECGKTRVLCTASFVCDVPRWRKDSELGWVTAEYNMLPGSTNTRKPRTKIGYTDSRGTEIQRLIGRVLRSAVDFEKLGPNSIYLDCDVLQADGGTRTAAINGSYIAMVDTVNYAMKEGFIIENPIMNAVAAISVGIIKGKSYLDLDYKLDSNADVDMNIAMNDKDEFIELQGTGEQATFSMDELTKMTTLARRGIKKILSQQKLSLSTK